MGQWPDNRLSVLMRLTDLERQRPFNFPDIRGWKVLSTTGRPIGSVKEVFVDPNSRQPAMALLQYKTFLNFNTKMLLAPWHELRIGPDFVMTRSTVDERRPETAAWVPSTCPASEVAAPVEMTMRPHPAAANERTAALTLFRLTCAPARRQQTDGRIRVRSRQRAPGHYER
jgi:hypothetical protein